MKELSGYRHEDKYLFPICIMPYIDMRIKSFAQYDTHGYKGMYNVYSVYFDDHNNSSLYENEDGVDPRRKWRIRIYNHDLNNIVLERKKKKNGLIMKDSQSISIETYNNLLNSLLLANDSKGKNYNKGLLGFFLMEQIKYSLKPKVAIDYERKAYICKYNAIRITLDYNIACIDNNFTKARVKYPLLEKGIALMEVKYSQMIPAFMTDIICSFDMKRVANSKYYMARISKMKRWSE